MADINNFSYIFKRTSEEERRLTADHTRTCQAFGWPLTSTLTWMLAQRFLEPIEKEGGDASSKAVRVDSMFIHPLFWPVAACRNRTHVSVVLRLGRAMPAFSHDFRRVCSDLQISGKAFFCSLTIASPRFMERRPVINSKFPHMMVVAVGWPIFVAEYGVTMGQNSWAFGLSGWGRRVCVRVCARGGGVPHRAHPDFNRRVARLSRVFFAGFPRAGRSAQPPHAMQRHAMPPHLSQSPHPRHHVGRTSALRRHLLHLHRDAPREECVGFSEHDANARGAPHC